MTKVAKDSGVQRETLYRSLSEHGNPTLQTLTSVLGAMGLRMRVEAEGSVGVAGEGAASPSRKRKDAEHTL
jgi:DNA-binding phage protein